MSYKLVLTSEEAADIVYNDSSKDGHIKVIEDRITSHSRWSVQHRVVLYHIPTDTYWQSHYSVGATEYQDESPWQHYSPKFKQVWPYQVTVTQYR